MLAPVWYRPIEPYIGQSVQIIASEGLLYVATARGLYALKAEDGEVAWVYPTELPLGHSPTIAGGVAYVGGFDRRLHAIDAKSGVRLWTFDEAEAGYHTNPLVVGGRVYAGNRDGAMYCVGAHGSAEQGKLVWKYQTGGPINFSAAWHKSDDSAGQVIFASMDLHGYALDAGSGELVWKTEKFAHTAGFQSIWPVVWEQKGMVVFCGNTPNYRGNTRPGIRSVPPNRAGHYHELEKRALYGERTSGYLGETGAQPGDWAEGTMTVDLSRGIEYYQQHPHRRSVFVVDLETGKEYTFEHEGKPAYAPFMMWGTKQQSPRAAPAIGPDGVLYQATHYLAAGTFGRGQVAGWTLGSRYLSIPNPRKHNAFDEPLGFSLGGDLLYWSLCCDREMGAHRTSGRGAWQYVNYNLGRLAPGYDEMWAAIGDQDGTGNRLWGAYGSNNGIYHNHTADQNSPIPYRGRLYVHRSNCVIAFGPRGEAAKKLPVAEAASFGEDSAEAGSFRYERVKVRLAAEVQKMLDAGLLRPGYFDGGQHFNRPIWGDGVNEYFHQPGDTVWALLRALPHLPEAMRPQVREYVAQWVKKYPLHRTAHIGWSGAAREHFELPPEVEADLAAFGPRPASQCLFWRFPPHSFYALWKYAAEFGDAAKLLASARGNLAVPCPVSDEQLAEYGYIANAYIAGYLGYVELQKLAGEQESAEVRAELDRLMKLRADTLSKDTPWTYTNRGSHVKRLSVQRNFLFLTPELAAYLREHAAERVQASLDEIDRVAPYWFVTHYEGCLQESTIQNLHDYGSVFAARAWILREPPAELGKYLDVPAFRVGDLNYLHQLVSLLEAPNEK
jgi:hypothetical protein